MKEAYRLKNLRVCVRVCVRVRACVCVCVLICLQGEPCGFHPR